MTARAARRWSDGLLVLCCTWVLLGAVELPRSNHLEGSASPYLQRASRQPVDWYPWGAQAWQRARQLDRPVLLDMGAVWCSWCSQMDRESYTNPEAATYINAHFVAVKVDYDADPELARQLELAQAVVNLPAGLPLTAFLTPSGKLFEGGSYFPPKAGHGKPSFREALEQASRMYAERRADVEKEGYQVNLGDSR
jgi:uncharacterized protein YyaL (SSP411 family)